METIKNIYERIATFSLPEAFSSNNGKTEMAYICAPIVIITGCILPFCYPTLGYIALGFVTAGTALLGIKVIVPTKEIKKS